MNSARIVRGLLDTTFISVRNLHSATVADGDCVRWHITGDAVPTGYTRIPGVDVVATAAVGVTSAAGIVKTPATTVTVAQGDYFMLQVHGYHSNVRTEEAALAAGVVVTGSSTSLAVETAVVAAAANISDKRLGVCLTTGASNRAGIQIAALGH